MAKNSRLQAMQRGRAGILRASRNPRPVVMSRRQRRGGLRVSAKMQGRVQPSIYRFKFGDFEISSILDSDAVRENLHPTFGGNQPAEKVHELALANRIDTARFEHPFIPTLVNTGKQLILFDTGNGNLRRDFEPLRARLPDGHLRARMAEAGYKPEDVDIVVTTHGHPDHIGGLIADGKPAFPNARYVFGAAEFDFWKRGENVSEARLVTRDRKSVV